MSRYDADMRMVPDEQLLAQLKTLYPNLSDEDLILAKEALDRYLLLAWEIYEDLDRQGVLTAFPASSSIDGKVDSPTN